MVSFFNFRSGNPLTSLGERFRKKVLFKIFRICSKVFFNARKCFHVSSRADHIKRSLFKFVCSFLLPEVYSLKRVERVQRKKVMVK